MVKVKTKRATRRRNKSLSNLELDSVFIFKIVLYLLLGSQWLYLLRSNNQPLASLPLGAIIGVAFILKDPQRTDRKIEYVLLLLAMFIGYWLPLGITVRV